VEELIKYENNTEKNEWISYPRTSHLVTCEPIIKCQSMQYQEQ